MHLKLLMGIVARAMIKFTLDTNCLIDLEEGRKGAAEVRKLVEAHRRGIANVAVATVTASERQKDGGFLETYEDFQARLVSLGLDHLNQIQPLAHFGISFFDHGLWTSQEMADSEAAIHDVLSPGIPISYPEYCEAWDIDPEARPLNPKWRNRLCDTQIVWSHIHHGRDVLVTSDDNFFKASKLPRLVALGAKRICRPAEAAEMLREAL